MRGVDEEASGYWPILWMMGVNDLDADTRVRLHALIGRADMMLPSFTAQEEGVWGGALRYRSALYGKDGDVNSFRRMLTTAAEQARRNYPSQRVSELSLKTPVVSTFHLLSEAIWQFSSVSSPTLNDCTTLFAEFVIVVADAWPNSLLSCLTLLEAIAAQLDTEPAGPLWDAINLLRSR